LLSGLLARPPDQGLLARLAGLSGDGTALGEAVGALAAAARDARAEAVEREFHDLFIGLGRGELLPYASYYLTGFLHERPLAKLRADLAALGIERAASVVEPEDHIATLCEVMAGLIDGSLGDGPEQDRRIFDRHLRPWAERFFADLEQAKAARFYRAVGRLGRVFIGIETEAFALPV
jgi:TorA maturation chaperone TorD